MRSCADSLCTDFPLWICHISRICTALRRRIAQFSADVVHSHYPPPFMSYGVVKGLPHVPHVLTYHCDLEIPDRIANLRIPNICRCLVSEVNTAMYTKPILDNVAQIIATTESYARTSPVLRGYRYEIVPNGIRLETFDRHLPGLDGEKRAHQILFVGRLSSVKGVDDFVKAAKIVLSQVSDATFLIVGDGEDRERLKKLAKGYEHRIKFCGHVSRGVLLKLYTSSSALVLPSFTRLEAFGLVLLEAMACETPVIASRIPGVHRRRWRRRFACHAARSFFPCKCHSRDSRKPYKRTING